MRKIWKQLFIAVLGLTVTGTAAAAPAGDANAKHIFVLGRISDKPQKHQPTTQAMANYLAEQLKDQGIKEGRAVIAKDAAHMAQLMKEGRVDMVNDTIFTASLLIDTAGGEALLKANRKGAASYRSVFIVRKDSPIKSLTDLRGRVVAFEDAKSASGYMLPAALLISHGLSLKQLQSATEKVPSGTVGYIFSGDAASSTNILHKKEVQAATFSNTDLKSEKVMPPEMARDLRVLYETVDFPRSLMIVRKNLAPTLKERLKQVLLAAPADARAEPLLADFHSITQFEPISKADQAGIEVGRGLSTIVRTKLK